LSVEFAHYVRVDFGSFHFSWRSNRLEVPQWRRSHRNGPPTWSRLFFPARDGAGV